MTNQEYMKNIEQYFVSLQFAKRLIRERIISNKDYDLIEEKLAEKYGININSLYRANDLIDSKSRGNITD